VNLGLHLYFRIDKDCAFHRTRTVNRTLICNIPHVDILGSGGIEGPTLKGRTILNLSSKIKRVFLSKDNLNIPPRFFAPLSKTEKQDKKMLMEINPKFEEGIKEG